MAASPFGLQGWHALFAENYIAAQQADTGGRLTEVNKVLRRTGGQRGGRVDRSCRSLALRLRSGAGKGRGALPGTMAGGLIGAVVC